MYIRHIFLIQMKYRLQSMHTHMVGRAASFVSPFYSILLGFYLALKTRRRQKINFEFIGNSKTKIVIFVYKVPCLIYNSTNFFLILVVEVKGLSPKIGKGLFLLILKVADMRRFHFREFSI